MTLFKHASGSVQTQRVCYKLTWCLHLSVRLLQRAVLFRAFSLVFHFLQKKILSFSDAVRKKYWCSVKMIVKFIWLSPCSAGVTCERTCGEEICQTESSSGGCQIRGAELCCEAPPADRPALWHRTATPWSLLHSWYILLMYMLKLEPVLTPIYTVG